MREPFAGSLFSRYVFAMLGFLAYGGVAVALLFKRGRRGLIGLAMLFPWLLFFTEFSVIRIQESFVLYRSYLWMAGIFIALPLLLMKIKPRMALISGGVLALLLAMVAVDRLTTFSHPLLLWDDAEKLVHDQHNLPGVDRIYGNRALSFDGIKRYPDAIADYQTALSLNPASAHYYQGMGIAYLNMNEYSKSIAAFSQAVALEPARVKSYYGRGMANAGLGNRGAALADLEKSCELGWQSGCAKALQLNRR
jgi:tetratricopeptide (TPR) repeat protein